MAAQIRDTSFPYMDLGACFKSTKVPLLSCTVHRFAETHSVPFSLEKTLEVLQCTSHQDLLKRGERGQVNEMV